eukprot:UN07956
MTSLPGPMQTSPNSNMNNMQQMRMTQNNMNMMGMGQNNMRMNNGMNMMGMAQNVNNMNNMGIGGGVVGGMGNMNALNMGMNSMNIQPMTMKTAPKKSINGVNTVSNSANLFSDLGAF